MEKTTMGFAQKRLTTVSLASLLLLLLVSDNAYAGKQNGKGGSDEIRLAEHKATATSNHTADDHHAITTMVTERMRESGRRKLGNSACGTGNHIDDCWMCSSVSWEQNPKLLADCGYGFGKATTGGRDGDLYYVTDDRDDDIVNPPPGTLRHGVLQDKPLWIMFKRNMVIHLKAELIITNDKTIDGRGVNVVLTGGGCITIQDVQNIIVHGLTIYGCQAVGGFEIRSSMSHVGVRELSDGDAISISHSKNIWIDHNTLSACKDGLVDVVAGSDAITISNNHFSNHNETILLGHLDTYTADKDMHVTLVYNRFGEKLIQRLPRLGTFHVVNNYYEGWEMYAIGHSANPTILSQGNVFNAATYGVKEVVHVNEEGDRSGNVLSVGDEMLGGAIFTATGSLSPSFYAKAASLTVRSPHMVDDMTKHAGAGFV